MARIGVPALAPLNAGASTAGTGVEMLESERLHLGEVISQKLGQFQAKNPATGTPTAYDLEVTVSRFEKGNAFARAMLAKARRAAGLDCSDDYGRLANVRRVLMAATSPAFLKREGHPAYLAAALEVIERLLPQVAR